MRMRLPHRASRQMKARRLEIQMRALNVRKLELEARRAHIRRVIKWLRGKTP